MKYTNSLLTGLLLLSSAFSAQATPHAVTGCAAKRQNIEKNINYARTHGNAHRAEGLSIALSELNANCTDAGLRNEQESDIRKKERKVVQAQQELVEAQADGRQDKIDKRQRKLIEAQTELQNAKASLWN
ncbi:DUF1090 domain-containing protein [Salmonella enterica subsp. salamae]|nr:DUF1090 domain-containing protein [Salmonella enterica subsp. salamae]